MATIERRRYPRNEVIVNVDIVILGGPSYEGCARNISQGGISVDIFGEDPPGDGAKAKINFIIWTGDEKIYRDLAGKVVRSNPSSVALVFDDDPQLTEKIIKEVLYYQQFERRKKPRPRVDSQL